MRKRYGQRYQTYQNALSEHIENEKKSKTTKNYTEKLQEYHKLMTDFSQTSNNYQKISDILRANEGYDFFFKDVVLNQLLQEHDAEDESNGI